MSNRKIFKKLYAKKINKDVNYGGVLEKLSNNSSKRNYYRRSLVAISFVVVLSVFIINQESFMLYFQPQTNLEIENKYYINENNFDESMYDNIDSTEISYKDIEKKLNYSFLEDLKIPNDLIHQVTREAYVGRKDILNHYEIIYQNSDHSRKINIAFSRDNKAIANYDLYREGKKSTINNIEVMLYRNNDSYKGIFSYKDINYNIYTESISEKEFMELILSIIK